MFSDGGIVDARSPSCRGGAPSFENRRGALPAAARSIRVANHNHNRSAARSLVQEHSHLGRSPNGHGSRCRRLQATLGVQATSLCFEGTRVRDLLTSSRGIVHDDASSQHFRFCRRRRIFRLMDSTNCDAVNELLQTYGETGGINYLDAAATLPSRLAIEAACAEL